MSTRTLHGSGKSRSTSLMNRGTDRSADRSEVKGEEVLVRVMTWVDLTAESLNAHISSYSTMSLSTAEQNYGIRSPPGFKAI